MNEELRIKEILAGNTSAFETIVDKYQNMAMTIAYRICNNLQDAEDVVQESFVKAFRNLHTFKLNSKFSTWFYRIVYNTSISHIRSSIWINNNEVDLSEASKIPETDNVIDINKLEQKKIVDNVLNSIPKGDSLILTLYYLDDESVKDIAKIVGLTESNVKIKLFRARKTFKEKLQSMYGNYRLY